MSSARGLLLTILGEFVLPSTEGLWTSALLRATSAVGIGEAAARQALARTAAAGWLKAEHAGRKAYWHLTPAGRRMLSTGAERIYGFRQERGDWDGQWVVVIASVPEAKRELRHRLRTRLGWAGFGSMGQGTWICPFTDREEEARKVVRELGVEQGALSFVARFGCIGDAKSVIARAWDLPCLEDRYTDFVRIFSRCRPVTPREMFVAHTSLVHAWRAFPLVDPDLPAALLPRSWSGVKAKEVFDGCCATWQSTARAWFQEGSSPPGDREGSRRGGRAPALS